MSRARDLADSADKDITGTLTVDGIGIGTTAPAHEMHIQGSGTTASMSLKGSGTGATASDGIELKLQGDNAAYLYNYENAMLRFGTNGLERMRIAADGTVSIPQKASGNTLQVATHIGAYEIALTGSTHANIVASNGANPFYIQNLGNGKMHFQTNATDRLVISNDGYITTPNQPVFSAYRNGTNVPDSTVIVWTNTTANVGSHYNTSNGKFTAPVTGNYFFSAFAMSPSTTGGFGIRLRLNGTPSGTTWAYVNSNTIYQYKTVSMGFVIGLNATDYIEIMTQGGEMHSTANFHNNFCGYLVG